MSVPVRIAAMAAAAALLAPAAAHSAEFCVKPYAGTGCLDTLTEALDAAAAQADGPDRILLGAATLPAPAQPWTDGGEPVAIVGMGAADTVLEGSLHLTDPESTVTGARIDPSEAADEPALELAGRAATLEIEAADEAVVLLEGAKLMVSSVKGRVTATGPAWLARTTVTVTSGAALVADAAALAAEDVALAGGGLLVSCGAGEAASIAGRHVTVTGADTSAATACALGTAALGLRSSVLTGAFDEDGGDIETAFSAHAADADVVATDRIDGDPLLDADGRPQTGSPLIDAGDPAPLADGELFEDLAGQVRVTDGDGDGIVRRDAGAHELQPPPVPLPTGNVLANPGAEEGLLGWGGDFGTIAYGAEGYPTLASGEALGAGAAFFAPTAAGDAFSLLQRIDVAGSARAIDTGGATAQLSGLLGGYGNDADSVTVTATSRDPEGNPIGALTIGPVTADERGRVTNLLLRSAAGSIPARTRAIDVVVAGTRVAGNFTDAYADNLGLVLSVPGVPVDTPPNPDGPVVPNLKPFAGVTVLHPRFSVTRAGSVRIALACASATVRACSGTLELRAILPRRVAATRIARMGTFSVKAGRRRGVIVALLAKARRALRGHRSIRATIVTIANDGQGVQRRRTVPIRLRLPKPAATRRGSRR